MAGLSSGPMSASQGKKRRGGKTSRGDASAQATGAPGDPDASLGDKLAQLVAAFPGDLAAGLTRLASEVGGAPLRVGRSLLLRPESAQLAAEAGSSLRELREVAGLTVTDLSDALDLQDQGLLQAVENGTATLSFELILRLSALLARHDPVPFVLRFTRTYNPEVWELLQGWGVGRLPLQYEREREVVNIYRSHDAARKLSDEGFARVLAFTRAAFEMSLHFVAQQESVEEEAVAQEAEEG